MGDIGFSELIAIVIIAILIYGKDLPQAARKLAAIYSKFRRQLTDIKDEIQRQIPDDEIRQLTDAAHYDPGLDPPTVPSGVTVTPTSNQVIITWGGSLGATSYTVKRSAGPAEPFYVVAMNVYELQYCDSDVQPGKTYHYAVVATNGAGESAPSDESIATLPGEAPPTSTVEAAPAAVVPAPPPSEPPAASAGAAPSPSPSASG